MRFALGIPCWADTERMIQLVIDSLQGYQDALIVADGVIDGVDAQGLSDTSDMSYLPAGTILEQRRWPSQGAKRDWILQTARELECDWLLQLDSDERLHEPRLLRRWLQVWRSGAFPVPFEIDRLQHPGIMLGASWKCLRVKDWRRVVIQGAFLEHMNGKTYLLVPPEGRLPSSFAEGIPYISHHYEERDETRRDIRLSWVEDQLEPVAQVACEPYPTPGYQAVRAVAWNEEFYCDQCGQRFSGPGVCAGAPSQHPPRLAQPLAGWADELEVAA